MITIHCTYCDEHMANHWLDERDRCYGESLHVPGYRYTRHIGGGWYRLQELVQAPMSLDWQMSIDEHVHIRELQEDEILAELGF